MRVTIEKLVYGGAGLARTPEGVIFVPRTAPADVVDIDIIERKADYSVGRIKSVVEPSPDRQVPTCPNYATAGCCHWQHIRYSRQLEIKESILRETLQRTARLEWNAPVEIFSGPDTHYRLRASFHVHNHKLGFVEERSHKVVPITQCSALTEELNEFVPRANEILQQPRMAQVREVHAISGPPVLAAFDKEPVGDRPLRLRVSHWQFDLHPLAFFQSNRYLLTPFIENVLKLSSGAKRILDLFCGSGFFSIPLSQNGAQVLGVESSRVAVRQANANARLNGAGSVQFFEGNVEGILRNSPEMKPDLIVLNPPRSGAGRTIAKQVAGLNADRLIYVSCNPSMFASESVVLNTHGYALQSLSLIDQFPNTYHIESIALFEKK
jgi:23S rRNA (uracil1939-C5)-methyltransferase